MKKIAANAGFCARVALTVAAYVIMTYLLEAAGASLVGGESPFLGILAGDIALAVLMIPLAWRQTVRGPGWEPVTKDRISASGWFLLLALFGLLYVSSEMTGLWLGYIAPSAGATESYMELSDADLYLYIVRAATVTPFVEEIGARLLLFRPLRARYGFWPAMICSALYFTAIHGTLMHIPLAIGLTMFNCVLYDATGKFRYCVLFHMLFNWMGATVIFSVPDFPVWARFALLIACYALMACLYVFRKKLFGGALSVGALFRFEAYLDGKLDELADKAEAEGRKQDSGEDGEDEDHG